MLHRIVALLLLLSTSPVTAELFDRSLHHHHQPRLGLTADARATDAHHDGDCDDERDCTPWCLNCRCHSRASVLIADPQTAGALLLLPSTILPTPTRSDGRESDRPVLPPPIA